MFKVYFSKLETKIQLAFDMYDFDRDGLISKEDIELVLSHVPLLEVRNASINYLG